MIFLDTNVAIDLITGEGEGAAWTTRLLADEESGPVLVCNLVVVAELAAGLRDPEPLLDDLDTLGIAIVDLDVAAALRAGHAHKAYRERGGSQSTILPDFLIAAHAEVLGARFMTRDRRIGSYFPDLTLITPETHP